MLWFCKWSVSKVESNIKNFRSASSLPSPLHPVASVPSVYIYHSQNRCKADEDSEKDISPALHARCLQGVSCLGQGHTSSQSRDRRETLYLRCSYRATPSTCSEGNTLRAFLKLATTSAKTLCGILLKHSEVRERRFVLGRENSLCS